ncbi:hypothetical protein E2C01_023204 [Portunus trituberculatus]|uniref:Uncharacterized protein n=1 Tax=Portunus trituberculatus TaxID=210409 RepID=A0A5B7E7D9_PORTR|nr:hypothetical protein [Portunus trituberculatus]
MVEEGLEEGGILCLGIVSQPAALADLAFCYPARQPIIFQTQGLPASQPTSERPSLFLTAASHQACPSGTSNRSLTDLLAIQLA